MFLALALSPCFARNPQSCALQERESPKQAATSTDQVKETSSQCGKYDLTQIGRRGIGKGLNLYSYEREKKLGEKLSKRMDHSLTIIDDPLVSACLNRIAQALVHHSEVAYNISVTLIYNNEEVNAYSLPAGHLYVTTGLLLNMQSESELAMVMAHEIAHVAARHDTRTWTREILWGIPFFPILKVPGPIGYSAGQLSSALSSLPVLKFDRDTEHEADLLGVQYAYSAGYDPQGMLDLYQRSADDDSRTSNFIVRLFNTHPSMKDRFNRAKAEISMFLPLQEQYVLDTSEFQEAKQHLEDLVHDMERADKASDPFVVTP